MRTKHVVMAGLLAAGSTLAWADDQTVSFANGVATFSSLGNGPALLSGSDTISFSGLAAGTYDFRFAFSSLGLDVRSVTVDGERAHLFGPSGLEFAVLRGTTSAPIDVVVRGARMDTPGVYSGELLVSAVPEPETAAMLLGGIAAIGFVLRRRRA